LLKKEFHLGVTNTLLDRLHLRTFTSAFKKQMVDLFNNGKTRANIVEEYDLTASALDRWIKQSQTSGSFKEKDNRSTEAKVRVTSQLR